MKKIILLTIGFCAGSLYSVSGQGVSLQETRRATCSLCGRTLIEEDFLQGALNSYLNNRSLVCRFCLKKLRGKGGKEEALSTLREERSSSFFATGDSDEGWASERMLRMTVPLLRAGRRRDIVLLRDRRTGLERKNKCIFKEIMEEEAQVAREYTWTYRVLDGRTVEVENGIKKVRCFSKSPLLSLWYRGSCAVFASERGYKLYDFYSGEAKKFSPRERDELTVYLERAGYGSDFKVYTFDRPAEKKERIRGERIFFSDEDSSSLITENKKSHFYYATDEKRKTLLVGNDDGYILKWPVEQTILGLLVRGTEAIITTQVGTEVRQLWHDFARHNENKMIFAQDYPITVLELPVQSKEDLLKQGFSESSVNEKTFDQMFHEMSIIPERFTQTFHSDCSLSELLGCLKCNKTRSLVRENDEYHCLLDAKKTKVEVTVRKQPKTTKKLEDEDSEHEEIEGFEIALNNSKDRLWKRGAEVLMPDNGSLVLYNFKTEAVERFDVQKIPSLETLGQALSELKFSEIK